MLKSMSFSCFVVLVVFVFGSVAMQVNKKTVNAAAKMLKFITKVIRKAVNLSIIRIYRKKRLATFLLGTLTVTHAANL